jgi:hypothetical protein
MLRIENDAVTLAALLTVQVPVPEQEPLQPLNWSIPEFGVAVSVTDEPRVKLAEHVDPQLIPLGELDTLPGPDTETSTE